MARFVALGIGLSLIGLQGVAASEVSDLHATWRGCLNRSFGLQASLASRDVAADTALRTCRPAETVYLTALAASPLLDADDVARVRAALLGQARSWLLKRRNASL